MNSRLLCSSKKTNGRFYIGTRGTKFEAFDADTRGITFSGTMDGLPTYTRGITFSGTMDGLPTYPRGITFPNTIDGLPTYTRGITFSGTMDGLPTYTRGVTFSGTGFAADTRGVKTNIGSAVDTPGINCGLQCFPLPPLLSCRSWQGSFFAISHLIIAGKTL